MKLFALKQTGKILFFYRMRLIRIPVNTYVNITIVKRKEREGTKTASKRASGFSGITMVR